MFGPICLCCLSPHLWQQKRLANQWWLSPEVCGLRGPGLLQPLGRSGGWHSGAGATNVFTAGNLKENKRLNFPCWSNLKYFVKMVESGSFVKITLRIWILTCPRLCLHVTCNLRIRHISSFITSWHLENHCNKSCTNVLKNHRWHVHTLKRLRYFSQDSQCWTDDPWELWQVSAPATVEGLTEVAFVPGFQKVGKKLDWKKSENQSHILVEKNRKHPFLKVLDNCSIPRRYFKRLGIFTKGDLTSRLLRYWLS